MSSINTLHPHPHPPPHARARGRPKPRIRALLIDISGTLLTSAESTSIPTTTHALTRLRTAKTKIPFRLCTNASQESHADLVTRLSRVGLGEREVVEREVWSSVGAVREVMRWLGVRRPYMLLSPSAMADCTADDPTNTPPSSNPNPNPNPNSNSNPILTTDQDASTSHRHTPRSTDSKSTLIPSPSPSPSPSTSSNVTDPPPPHPGAPNTDPQLEYDAVIIGLAPPKLDYDHLNTAFQILIRESPSTVRVPVPVPVSKNHQPNERSSRPSQTRPPTRPPLIALHKARYIASSTSSTSAGTVTVSGLGLSLGPGPFVSALEEATGTRAIVVGKPSRRFFEGCLRDLGLVDDIDGDVSGGRDGDGNGDECKVEGRLEVGAQGEVRVCEKVDEQGGRRGWEGVAVIGDDVEADLGGGAVELGLWRVLVRTGKYRAGDENREGIVPPDEVCDSFAVFVDDLLGGTCHRE